MSPVEKALSVPPPSSQVPSADSAAAGHTREFGRLPLQPQAMNGVMTTYSAVRKPVLVTLAVISPDCCSQPPMKKAAPPNTAIGRKARPFASSRSRAS
jgi:hypothetical protein